MNDNEDLRNVFAGLCAMALIMRGLPDDDVPSKAFEMADKLIKAKDIPQAGLATLKKTISGKKRREP